MKRVVVTGLGVLSCIGNDVNTFWNNLIQGYCGIDYLENMGDADLAVKIGGQVRGFNPEDYGIEKPFSRKQALFTVFAVAAAKQAMDDSGLKSGENIDPFRLGTYVSSGIGGFDVIYRECAKMVEAPSGEWISPLFIPTMIGNMAAGQVAIRNGAQGSCLDIATACASSTHSVGEAYRAIAGGYADAIIAGGSENGVVPMGIAGFANAKAITRDPDPKHASLPFNLNRGGFVMADGAGILILEEYGHAVKRGAKIYAEVCGYGSTCDAYHATAPRPDGTTQAECISEALREAGYDGAKDRVYINAHGTGTHLNDLAETQAIKLAFGEDEARKCRISSTKSMHGHMFGATGAVEAIATVLTLKNGIIPPTINLDVPDPECDLDYTPGKAVKAEVNLGLSDSFGFGGHNGCLAFRKI